MVNQPLVDPQRYVDLWNEGKNTAQIANELGMSPTVARRHLRRARLAGAQMIAPQITPKEIVDARRPKFEEMMNAGLTYGEIGAALGLSKSRCMAMRVRFGLAPRKCGDGGPGRPKGATNVISEAVTPHNPHNQQTFRAKDAGGRGSSVFLFRTFTLKPGATTQREGVCRWALTCEVPVDGGASFCSEHREMIRNARKAA